MWQFRANVAMNKPAWEDGLLLDDVLSTRARLHRLSRWLDHGIRIPGTRWRFGLDAIVGLVPGVGDLVGLMLSGFVLMEGARIGAPRGLMLRMLGITLLDLLLGLVPLVGDLADAAFQSNRINARLLLRHLERQELALGGSPPPHMHWGAFVALLLLLTAFAALGLALLQWFWS